IDGSHVLATREPSPLSGTLVVSPFGAVRMRHCQSSVTTDTHVPVRSTGAPTRPCGAGAPPPRPPPPPRPCAAKSGRLKPAPTYTTTASTTPSGFMLLIPRALIAHSLWS